MAPSLIAPIDLETPAEFIGTTRPCVSFFVNKPGKSGLIGDNGHR